MVEIYRNIFVGNEQDYYLIQNNDNWAVLHCCKNPFHCMFVGYKGNLPSDHPDYAFKRRFNEMALNLVDMDRFDPNYLGFNKNIFSNAFEFLDEYYNKGYKLLIHCNQGESRAPMLGMLYAARLGAFDYKTFNDTYEEFHKIYYNFYPKENIYFMVKNLWDIFVIKKN